MLSRSHFHLSLFAAALSSALAAHAQQTPIQQVEVKGAADSYDARRDDTASRIVVNRDEIVKYGDTNVLDVLKRLPGVTVTGASGRGGEVRMRGLGNGYTQVLLNGERAPAGFSMESLAPDSIERIELIRGGNAEFSSQAIAGTINIVLKKAIKAAQRELKVSLGGGDGSFTPTYNLQMSDRKGKLSYSLSVNGVHNFFTRDTPSTEESTDNAGNVILLRNTAFRENGRFDGVNIGPRLNWSFDNGDTLTSQSFINFGRFARDSQTTVTPVVGGPGRYPYLEWDMTNENLFFRTDLNWVKKIKGGAKLDVKVGGLIGALRNDSYRDGYTARDGDVRLDSYVKSRGTDRGYNTTGKYSTPIFEGHALSMGWDVGFNTRDDARLQRDSVWYVPPPGSGQLPGLRPDNRDEEYTGDVTRLNAFVQDEWNVTPRLSVYLGVRWESVSTKVSGNDFEDSKTSSEVFSPTLNVLYKLPNTKGDQVRLGVNRSYKAPNTQSLIPRRFASANNSSTEPDFIGNPNLRPELATGLDIAYEHFMDKGALVSISAYARRLTDSTRNVTRLGDDGIYVSMPSNSGSARAYGVEFEAKFPVKLLVPTAPAIDLRANLSRNWSSVDDVPGPYSRLDQQTPFSGTIGADYKAGRLTTGASYSLRTGGFVQVAENQAVFTSVRRDLEMYGLWKVDAKNQVRVALVNVLGQDFINESIFSDGSGLQKRRTASPQPAVLRATWELKF
ncbi:TonB-dependent receptor [Massilia sp. PAMC28688]|uniref:TonB-dependent receptor plug domain-containing protein n=1 Tax=Massilia sp. PAMC28688 TaxID=2861283 RepID=UPI001C62904A|nr:TonB-dependent receptor [Massilia sp. PAMC28688]QYF93375.1 TonB-dependent receptor [Massilia sp. PAMC28688]